MERVITSLAVYQSSAAVALMATEMFGLNGALLTAYGEWVPAWWCAADCQPFSGGCSSFWAPEMHLGRCTS
jgi:hypothetical protein